MQDKLAREVTLSEMAYGADMIPEEELEMYETGDCEGYVDSCADLVDSIASRVSD